MIVEDGTGKSDAESYVSLADANAYHEVHGNSSWAALSDEAKEAALRYATRWLDGKYRWRGAVLNGEQALGWPREDATDDEGRTLEGVPNRVKAAANEMALAHVEQPVNETVGARVVREKVDVIEVQYADQSGNEGQRYPIVDALLRGLARRTGAFVELKRA